MGRPGDLVVGVAVNRATGYTGVAYDFVRSEPGGAVVFVGDGKSADALKPFWKKIRRCRAKIEAVAIDMGPAYIAAVRENLPHAAIVFDRFHVTKMFNDKLSDLRRDLYRELTDCLQKEALKGSRWLLLKNAENLSEDRNEKERLREALRLNEPLAVAYYMKEELRLFWEQEDRAEAERFLVNGGGKVKRGAG